MNENFDNGKDILKIDETGIYHISRVFDYPILFPFGSMDSITYELLGGFTIRAGSIIRDYSPKDRDEKKKLKGMISTLESLNRSAERTQPIKNYGKEDNGIESNVSYGKQSEMTKEQSFGGYGIIIAIGMVIVIIITVLSSRDTGKKWSNLSEQEKKNAKWAYELMQEME